MKRQLNRIWLFIMQKWLIIPIIVAVIVGAALLVPAFSRYPETALDGAKWDRSWEMLGTVLGVEPPGKAGDLYPAQVYLLLYGCADDAAAREACADWMGREEATYAVRERAEASHNGLDYALMYYDCGSDTNPYSRGVSAFAVRDHYVVIAELICTEVFEGDEAGMMDRFLDGCHYGAK